MTSPAGLLGGTMTMMSTSPSLSSTFSRAGGADNDYNATIKRLAIEAHRWFEEALLDKVVGRDDNGGRGGQDKGRASVITNAQRRLLLMFHRCYPTRNPTCVLFNSNALLSILGVHKQRNLYKFLRDIDKSYRPSSHRAVQRLYSGRSSNSPEKRETRIKKKNLPSKKIQAIHFPKSCRIIPASNSLLHWEAIYLVASSTIFLLLEYHLQLNAIFS
jgi:hypothetical protein